MKTDPTDSHSSQSDTREPDDLFPDIFHSLERWLVILVLFGIMIVSAPVTFA